MSNHKISIVIVTFERLAFLEETIHTLLNTLPQHVTYELVIFDNASTDPALRDYLRNLKEQLGDKVTLILNDANLGWGAAVNIALKHTTHDLILLSNNDVTYSENWYEEATQLYSKYTDRLGILGLWEHISHGTIEILNDELKVKDDMPAVAWLLTRQTLDKLGPLAEHGPCATKGGNGEDTNYTQRAKAAGLLVACNASHDLAVHMTGY